MIDHESACVSAVYAVRVFKVRLAVDANRLHLIRFLKESEKSAAGGRSLSQPESKALRFFLKINRASTILHRINKLGY